MLVQTKEAKLWLNIAEILRSLTVGELWKISRSTFEVADDFERLAGEFTNENPSWEQWSSSFELVQEVKKIKGINELMANYILGRTTLGLAESSSPRSI
jgi:hypothetical protein